MALESVFWTIVTNRMTPQDIMEDNFGMFPLGTIHLRRQHVLGGGGRGVPIADVC